nr:MAG TPA: hypothetical protein [Caudoviricetes sp.]
MCRSFSVYPKTTRKNVQFMNKCYNKLKRKTNISLYYNEKE